MTVRERQAPPAGHGEVLCTPPFATWADLARANHEAAAGWPERLRTLRADARRESVALATAYSALLGIPATGRDLPTDALIVMTGHQPELYHPGVWVKDFLVQRLAEESGALAMDLVVDTDAAGKVALKTPCFRPNVQVCEDVLALGVGEAAYVQTPVPDDKARSLFRSAGLSSLSTLPAPALARHFATFCNALDAAAATATDLGMLLTATRRRYEAPAETDYLELAMSRQATLPAFRRFAAMLLLDAARFRQVLNEALGRYRERTGTRSLAQPFPDLAEEAGRVETPFWVLRDGARMAASVDARGTLFAGAEPVAPLGATADGAAEALAAHGVVLVPRAVTLTLFQRLFVADLFVHGTGGGRYDRVTDAVVREFFGVEPPTFAVASMTLLLPLGARIVTDSDVAHAEQQLHRFEHNPDTMLDEVEFDTPEERARAEEIAAEKAGLVAAIAAPGADRKVLGLAIREANRALATLLEPVAEQLRANLERTRGERDASAVLTDRTYPYCLWDPREVMDKVR